MKDYDLVEENGNGKLFDVVLVTIDTKQSLAHNRSVTDGSNYPTPRTEDQNRETADSPDQIKTSTFALDKDTHDVTKNNVLLISIISSLSGGCLTIVLVCFWNCYSFFPKVKDGDNFCSKRGCCKKRDDKVIKCFDNVINKFCELISRSLLACPLKVQKVLSPCLGAQVGTGPTGAVGTGPTGATGAQVGTGPTGAQVGTGPTLYNYYVQRDVTEDNRSRSFDSFLAKANTGKTPVVENQTSSDVRDAGGQPDSGYRGGQIDSGGRLQSGRLQSGALERPNSGSDQTGIRDSNAGASEERKDEYYINFRTDNLNDLYFNGFEIARKNDIVLNDGYEYHSCYGNIKQRLLTYASDKDIFWPQLINFHLPFVLLSHYGWSLKPRSMSEVSIGKNLRVVCHDCDLGLEGWEIGDSSIVEHVKHYPDFNTDHHCNFLQRKLTELKKLEFHGPHGRTCELLSQYWREKFPDVSEDERVFKKEVDFYKVPTEEQVRLQSEKLKAAEKLVEENADGYKYNIFKCLECPIKSQYKNADVLFLPCAHMCLCKDCADSLKPTKCPQCDVTLIGALVTYGNV